MVLYKKSLSDSTFCSLKEADQTGISAELLIYDNSPSPQNIIVDTELWGKATYIHDPTNGGLVPAYNLGLKMAKEGGLEWVLLLDQDSKLPSRYFQEMRDTPFSEKVISYIPRVRCNGRVISPVGKFQGIGISRLNGFQPGSIDKEIIAINSGMFIRVDFLDKIGGYSTDFSLDYVDHWFCREAYKNNKKFYLMNQELEHELSINNLEEVSKERFESILNAERSFMKTQGSSFLYSCILLYRSIKLRVFQRNKPLSKMSFAYFMKSIGFR